mgnify:CR=1 FL=1
MSAIIAPFCFDLALWLLLAHFWSVAVQPWFLWNHCRLFFRSCIFQASRPDLLGELFKLSRIQETFLLAFFCDTRVEFQSAVVIADGDEIFQVAIVIAFDDSGDSLHRETDNCHSSVLPGYPKMNFRRSSSLHSSSSSHLSKPSGFRFSSSSMIQSLRTGAPGSVIAISVVSSHWSKSCSVGSFEIRLLALFSASVNSLSSILYPPLSSSARESLSLPACRTRIPLLSSPGCSSRHNARNI